LLSLSRVCRAIRSYLPFLRSSYEKKKNLQNFPKEKEESRRGWRARASRATFQTVSPVLSESRDRSYVFPEMRRVDLDGRPDLHSDMRADMLGMLGTMGIWNGSIVVIFGMNQCLACGCGVNSLSSRASGCKKQEHKDFYRQLINDAESKRARQHLEQTPLDTPLIFGYRGFSIDALFPDPDAKVDIFYDLGYCFDTIRLTHALSRIKDEAMRLPLLPAIVDIRERQRLDRAMVLMDQLDPKLHRDQRDAIQSLRHNLELIQGPPGTGKSFCISEYARNCTGEGLVIICAVQNRAVDLIVQQLVKANDGLPIVVCGLPDTHNIGATAKKYTLASQAEQHKDLLPYWAELDSCYAELESLSARDDEISMNYRMNKRDREQQVRQIRSQARKVAKERDLKQKLYDQKMRTIMEQIAINARIVLGTCSQLLTIVEGHWPWKFVDGALKTSPAPRAGKGGSKAGKKGDKKAGKKGDKKGDKKHSDKTKGPVTAVVEVAPVELDTAAAALASLAVAEPSEASLAAANPAEVVREGEHGLDGGAAAEAETADHEQDLDDIEEPEVSVPVDALVIDESGLCPEYTGALFASLKPRQLVLFGDVNQLPPFSYFDEQAAPLSLVARLQQRAESGQKDVRIPVPMLATQYRMHPKLCELVSDTFYKGRLTTDQRVSVERKEFYARTLNLQGAYWIGYEYDEETRAEMAPPWPLTGLQNPHEVDQILKVLHAMLFSGSLREGDRTVSIITFYRAQYNLFIQKLEEDPHNVPLRALYYSGQLRVQTVDSAQGTEADYVLLSCVRSNPEGRLGFLNGRNGTNRVCVAMSRARVALMIFANTATLKHKRELDEIYEFCTHLPLDEILSKAKTYCGHLVTPTLPPGQPRAKPTYIDMEEEFM
jgi:hypothetical protein